MFLHHQFTAAYLSGSCSAYFNFLAEANHFHNSNPMVWLITEVQARVPDDAGGTPDYMDPALI
jgi:hypothetical protein